MKKIKKTIFNIFYNTRYYYTYNILLYFNKNDFNLYNNYYFFCILLIPTYKHIYNSK